MVEIPSFTAPMLSAGITIKARAHKRYIIIVASKNPKIIPNNLLKNPKNLSRHTNIKILKIKYMAIFMSTYNNMKDRTFIITLVI